MVTHDNPLYPSVTTMVTHTIYGHMRTLVLVTFLAGVVPTIAIFISVLYEARGCISLYGYALTIVMLLHLFCEPWKKTLSSPSYHVPSLTVFCHSFSSCSHTVFFSSPFSVSVSFLLYVLTHSAVLTPAPSSSSPSWQDCTCIVPFLFLFHTYGIVWNKPQADKGNCNSSTYFLHKDVWNQR